MAIKKDVTDEKGVKTRYHKIRRVEIVDGQIVVHLVGYVNATLRDAEKAEADKAVVYAEYQEQVEAVKLQLSSSALVGDERAEVLAELDRLLQSAPPVPQETKLYYNETAEILDYFEPITITALYEVLLTTDTYAGGESI